MKSLRRLLLVPALFLCAGCAWYWEGPHKSSSRYRIDTQSVESIVVGSTTMEDVLLRFGEPQEQFEGPTVFLYRWMRIRGFAFFVLWAGNAVEESVEYTLHIVFDENDKVTRHNVSKVVLGSSYPR